MNYTWRDLWHEAWPNAPISEASEQDVALFTGHAESLNEYNAARRTREREAFAALLELGGDEE